MCAELVEARVIVFDKLSPHSDKLSTHSVVRTHHELAQAECAPPSYGVGTSGDR